jgi:2-keto-4-pentenoate hydratase/2-oxohepta-3-ene-1,7-dioic acid hydratase in catechol pathway
MFSPLEHPVRGWPGRIEGDRVIQLAAQTLEAFFTGGGHAREHAEYRLDEVRLLAPIGRPPSVRDFYAFEEHVRNAAKVTGRPGVPDEWYEIPAFYFSNPAAVFGPDEEVPYPEGSEELDYELEVAAVIGAEGRISGFTVMNDWSARDLQRREMKIGLGPAKGKDFATSLGPVLVTPDDLGDLRLEMIARVNGEEPRRHVPLVGGDRRARGAEHGAAARRRPRLRNRRDRLHSRARRRALAAARRRGRARGRGDRRASQPDPVTIRS